MNKIAVARELMAIAKELTADKSFRAAPKMKKIYREDRDRYEEVNVSVDMGEDMLFGTGLDDLIGALKQQQQVVAAELSRIIRKYGLKYDSKNLSDVRVKMGDGRSLVVRGGFATDLGELPMDDLKREGYVYTG